MIGASESCRSYPAGGFVIATTSPGADWAEDAAEVTADRDPDGLFNVAPSTPPTVPVDPLREAKKPFSIGITLGEAEGHDRSGIGLLRRL